MHLRLPTFYRQQSKGLFPAADRTARHKEPRSWQAAALITVPMIAHAPIPVLFAVRYRTAMARYLIRRIKMRSRKSTASEQKAKQRPRRSFRCGGGAVYFCRQAVFSAGDTRTQSLPSAMSTVSTEPGAGSSRRMLSASSVSTWLCR